MKQKVIDIGFGEVYVINIPETKAEGVLSTQDRVIMYLSDCLAQCEERVAYIEEENQRYRLKQIKFLMEAKKEELRRDGDKTD